jgi:hypothetical protein
VQTLYLALALFLLLIWLLVLFAGAGVSYLVARGAWLRGGKPWIHYARQPGLAADARGGRNEAF